MEHHYKIATVNDFNRFDDEHEEEEEEAAQIPIHSQVVKIKKEIEKIRQPSLQEPEMKRVRLLRNACTKFQRHTRSPLGLAERPISLLGN
ncbi:hypothetical protein CsatA_011799 [Cannabis sativa]